MDWKIWLFGKKPHTIIEYEVVVRNYKIMMWIWVFVSLFMFFGVSQQQGEIDNCWVELQDYRMADSIIAGVPVSNCYIENNLLICDEDFSSIT